jgi:hypothetical protein
MLRFKPLLSADMLQPPAAADDAIQTGSIPAVAPEAKPPITATVKPPVATFVAAMSPPKADAAPVVPADRAVGGIDLRPPAESHADSTAEASAPESDTSALSTIAKPAAPPAASQTPDGMIVASRPADGSATQTPAAIGSAVPTTPPHPAAIHASGPLPAPAILGVPLGGLAIEISARARAGGNRFDIRLDPPELGRIDVRLHVDAHGRVTSHLVADHPATLDLLRRDAADLQRLLQDAGLKTGDNGLQFSLRDQPPNPQEHEGPRRTARVVVPDTESIGAHLAPRSYTTAGQGSGLDIRV